MTNKTLLEKLERADKELKRLHDEEELKKLRDENENLSKRADKYQRALDKLHIVIRSRYDENFSLEDI